MEGKVEKTVVRPAVVWFRDGGNEERTGDRAGDED